MKEAFKRLSPLAKFGWFVLGWNVVVILWGVFLRASKSGDGCGQHWLTCHGEVIPSAPELKTLIEFSHRIMSAVDGLLVIGLLGWALWIWYKCRERSAKRVVRTAAASLFFVLTEGAIGAGLVLTGNTAETLTAARPFWSVGHLLNTFILLAFLTLTARYASGGAPINWRAPRSYLVAIAVGVAVIFFVGVTGSIAALSHMLFPAGTLVEGMAADFSPASHTLLRLRLLHPITALLTNVFLIFLSGWLSKECEKAPPVVRWSNILSLLVLVQIVFGSLTLFMLAPIVMQIGHLLLADAIWISYVLMAANFLSRRDQVSSDE